MVEKNMSIEACGEMDGAQSSDTLANVASQSVYLGVDSIAYRVEALFKADENLIGVMIVDENDGHLHGMISRKHFMELYSKAFRKELYNKKPLKLVLADDFDEPLCLDEADSIEYAVRTALSRSSEQMYEPIVVKAGQGVFKLIDTQVLLLEMAKVFENQSLELRDTLTQVNRLNFQLEESQERILESLNYASVIQESILPRREQFDRLFSEWFAIYNPLDIVGGDMYWLHEVNGFVLLAVIDCTGHGVPGAFMTMTVNSVLNHIVDTICNDDPARILGEANRVLQKTLNLRCDGESTVDAGMDICLCCMDLKQQTLTYAGAGLSLYLYSGGELSEIRSDRAGIGYSGCNPDFQYTNHTLDIGIGTIVYATTDGFLDESGGAKGFGFGRERFKKMIEGHVQLSFEQQKERFEQTLSEWRGARKQRDDVTMVGFKL